MDFKILLYILQIIVSLSACYFTGLVLLFAIGLQPTERHALFFSRLLTGLTFLIVVFSCWHTSFKTVHLGFLILGPVLFFQLKQPCTTREIDFSREKVREEAKLLGNLFAVAILLFAIRYWWGFGIQDYPFIHMDNNFYGKVSGYILKYGVETPRLEYIFPETAYVQPYHYYELWLNAAIYKFMGGPIVPLLYLVTYAVGIAIVWAGLCALAAPYFKMASGIRLICFMALFLMGVNFMIYGKLLIYPYPIRSSIFDYAKTFPIYLFLVAAILFLRKLKIREACTVLLALPLVSVITAPAVFVSLVGFPVYSIIQKKKTQGIQVGLVTLAILIFYYFFYKSATVSGTTPYKSFIFSNYNSILSAENLKIAGEIFFKTFPKIVIVYAFFLGLIFSSGKFRKQDLFLNKEGIFLLAGLFVSALASWALLHNMMNTNQFFTNAGIPVVNLLVYLGLVISLRVSKMQLFYVFGLVQIFIMNFLENVAMLYFRPEHKTAYIRSVLKNSEGLNPLGGYIKAPEDYYTLYLKSSNVYPLGSFMGYSPDHGNYHTISLSVFDIPLDSAKEQRALENQLIENTSFYRFVQKLKTVGTFQSIAQSQVDFVDSCHMQYLLVSKNASLPELLKSKVTKTIIDPASGEKFYLLIKPAPAN